MWYSTGCVHQFCLHWSCITLSWKVGKGIISTTIQSRSRRFKHGKRRQRWENFINLQKRRKQQWELQEGNTRGETERRLSKKARAGEWGGSSLVWRDYVESSFKSTQRATCALGVGLTAVLSAKQVGLCTRTSTARVWCM